MTEFATPTQILRSKWPKAFPADPEEVRPLADGARKIIVETCGWSKKRTSRILEKWKSSDAYRKALLKYPKGIHLDGSESEDIPEERRTRVRETIARQQQEMIEAIKMLQTKWPKIFPANPNDVRPLAGNLNKAIAESCGWSVRYAHKVLAVWRKRVAYRRAVLVCSTCINLDGTEISRKKDAEAA